MFVTLPSHIETVSRKCCGESCTLAWSKKKAGENPSIKIMYLYIQFFSTTFETVIIKYEYFHQWHKECRSHVYIQDYIQIFLYLNITMDIQYSRGRPCAI